MINIHNLRVHGLAKPEVKPKPVRRKRRKRAAPKKKHSIEIDLDLCPSPRLRDAVCNQHPQGRVVEHALRSAGLKR